MPREVAKGLARLRVGYGNVVRARGILEKRVLRTNARIVEAGCNGMCLADLPVVVLQQVGTGAMQHTDAARADRGGVMLALKSFAAGLYAPEFDLRVVR